MAIVSVAGITPGVYTIQEDNIASVSYNGSINEIGLVGESNWGPTDSLVRLNNINDAYTYFGNRQTGELIKYLDTIFIQAGGSSNAGCAVWCKRVSSDTGGTKATRSITAGTDTAIVITAKYKGTFGNSIKTQITAGSLSGTFNLTISVGSGTDSTPWNYSKTYTNMTNTSTDERYFLNVVKGDTYIDIAKTGTATDNPANDSVAVALSTGTDFTVASGNYVTAAAALKSVPYLRGIVFAKTTDSTLHAAASAFSVDVPTALSYVCPIDTTSIATIVAEMKSNVTENRSVTYPTDYQYYNLETGLYEAQPIAWAVGVTYRSASNISPLNKELYNDATFDTEISLSDFNTLCEYGVFIGGYVPGRGTIVRNAVIEYRTKDNLTETTKSDIAVVRKAIDIEADVDSVLSLAIGGTIGWDELKLQLIGLISGRLDYWKSIGWISVPYDGSASYEISFPEINASTYPTGVVHINIVFWTSPTLRQIINHVWKKTS